MKKMLNLLMTLLILLASTVTIFAHPNPTQDFYVYDEAGIFTAEEQRELAVKANELYEINGTQVVMVIVNDLDGKSSSDYAYDLFNAWGIGSKEKQNGILIFLAVNDRRYEMMTGPGIEDVFTARYLGQVRDEILLPQLKNNNFREGMLNTYNEIYNRAVSLADIRVENQEKDLNRKHFFGRVGVLLSIILAGLVTLVTGLFAFLGIDKLVKNIQAKKQAKRDEELRLIHEAEIKALREQLTEKYLADNELKGHPKYNPEAIRVLILTAKEHELNSLSLVPAEKTFNERLYNDLHAELMAEMSIVRNSFTSQSGIVKEIKDRQDDRIKTYAKNWRKNTEPYPFKSELTLAAATSLKVVEELRDLRASVNRDVIRESIETGVANIVEYRKDVIAQYMSQHELERITDKYIEATYTKHLVNIHDDVYSLNDYKAKIKELGKLLDMEELKSTSAYRVDILIEKELRDCLHLEIMGMVSEYANEVATEIVRRVNGYSDLENKASLLALIPSVLEAIREKKRQEALARERAEEQRRIEAAAEAERRRLELIRQGIEAEERRRRDEEEAERRRRRQQEQDDEDRRRNNNNSSSGGFGGGGGGFSGGGGGTFGGGVGGGF